MKPHIFDKSAVKLIFETASRELLRWGGIVESNENAASTNNEREMLRKTFQLLAIFIESKEKNTELDRQLSAQDFGHLIECLENSMIDLEKNLASLKDLNVRVKQEGILQFGDQMIDMQ